MGGREAEAYSKCGPAVREMSARHGDHAVRAAIGHIPRVKKLREDRCWHELPALTWWPEEKTNIILEAKWSRTCAPAQVEGTQDCASLCEASTEVAMMLLIKPEYYGEFVEELAEMHRLRYRVFKQRLEWEVQVRGTWRSTRSMSLGLFTCCSGRAKAGFRVVSVFSPRPALRC